MFEESLAIERRLGRNVAGALNQLGTVAALQGDLSSAQAYYEDAYALWLEQGDELSVAMARCNLANTTRAPGELESAKMHGHAALETFERLDHKLFTANAHQALGDVAREMGDQDLARVHYLKSMSIRSELGQPGGLYFALIGFACLRGPQGDPPLPARLHGFVETYLEAMPPLHQMMLDAAAEQSVSVLGQSAHDAAYTEGVGLTLDEAVAYAAGELTWEELAPVAEQRLAAADAAEAAG
jgi:tetratricopeptide (TPR) repeat protein